MAAKVLITLALALAVLTALTLWRAARHEARVQATHPPSGQFLTIDGHRLHYWVSGTGPDLVLIHGASGNLRDMTFSLAPRLAERYRVIAFDRPGLGYSDRINRTGATIRQQAALLSRAAAELGADRPLVLGHSYGGAVALAWAVDHPDRIAGLVLVASPSNTWESDLSLYYRITSSPVTGAVAVPLITAFVPDSVIESTIDEIFAPQDTPTGYDAHVGPGLTLRRETLRANARQRANILAEITDLVPHYGALDLPVELVHGDADTTVGLTIHSVPLSEQVAGAALTVLPGVGHMPHHVAEDEVVAAVDRAASRAGLR